MKVRMVSEMELAPGESERIFREVLESMSTDVFEEDGKWYRYEDNYHGSPSREKAEKPSKVQLAANALIQAIRESRK